MHHWVLEYYQSKKISNDQELIQSDPISCPQSLFKRWSWVDLDLFYGKVKFGPDAFVWEKDKTMDFSEIIVV